MAGPGRVAVILEYDGSRFHGWQYQKQGHRSVAGVLQQAIEAVANESVEMVCAGRTDAGVHAAYQVVHFDTAVSRSLRSWVLGINSHLPGDVRVHWAGDAPADFSARFSATARRYRYLIADTPVRPALFRDAISWTHRPLDATAMHRAAQVLRGEHDFSAFRAAGCQARSASRYIEDIRVWRQGAFVLLDITANAFLHHMVRNIAGTLMTVGKGDAPESWVGEVLERQDRRQAGITAPPQGLYLVDVRYPEHFGIPRGRPGPSLVHEWPGGEL